MAAKGAARVCAAMGVRVAPAEILPAEPPDPAKKTARLVAWLKSLPETHPRPGPQRE